MNEHVLVGCRTEPLGSYLKALGVLCLVGEQVDRDARGWWRGDTFVLRTQLDRDALVAFFCERYRPTPAVSPWNGGSGFKADKNPSAVAALTAIESSTDPRLSEYRVAITAGRNVREAMVAGNWDKATTVSECRNRLPDPSLAWLDTAVVLASEKEVYPPLLGTGGNDGRFDFSIAFMQRLADVLCLASGRGTPTLRQSADWLDAALFATSTQLLPEPVGQFDPGSAGGPNSSPLGTATSLVNPWDWVFLIEGTMLFAGASARRLGAQAFGRAAVPFTVDPSAVGYGSSAAGESSRGEIWAPVWPGPCMQSEIARLIGEGRAEWRGRQARSGLDIARATAALGVDRGIARFVRHALLERNGLATAAVPVGVVDVRSRPAVVVAAGLDPWLDRVRRGKNPPTGISTVLRVVDSALFDLATRGGPAQLQRVLVSVADLEAVIGRSSRFRADAKVPPVYGLSADAWLAQLDDATAEFRIAAAMASQRDVDGSGLRCLLRGVRRTRQAVEWADAGAPVEGFGQAPLTAVLAAALARRSIEVGRAGTTDDDVVGVQTAFRDRIAAPLVDIAAFIAGELDDHRIERLLAALLLLDWRSPVDVAGWYASREGLGFADPAWTVLAPFFHGSALRGPGNGGLRLVPESSWPAQLVKGETQPVLAGALRRLRQSRLPAVLPETSLRTVALNAAKGERLAAALLCPMSTSGANRLLDRIVPKALD